MKVLKGGWKWPQGILNRKLLGASEQGNLRGVKNLLKKGADMNAMDESRFTPLHIASAKGYNEIAMILIDRGADIHARGWRGFSRRYHRLRI